MVQDKTGIVANISPCYADNGGTVAHCSCRVVQSKRDTLVHLSCCVEQDKSGIRYDVVSSPASS